MRTRLLLRRPGGRTCAVTLVTDATATAGDLATTLHRTDPAAVTGEPVLRIHRPEDTGFRTVPSGTSLAEAGLRAGSTIALGDERSEATEAESEAVARLVVIAGPDSGREVDLPAGSATVGRGPDCDLRLTDPLVSRVHARLLISDDIEVVDAGSANGVVIGDGTVTRAQVRPDDIIVLGGTELQVQLIDPGSTVQHTGASGAVVPFNRSPRLVARYPERTVDAPDVPEPPKPSRFPLLAMIAPMLMGGAMFAFTRNPMSLMFLVLSPMMMVGNWWSTRSGDKGTLQTETAAFYQGLDQLTAQITRDHEVERRSRLAEAPSTRDTVGAALGLAPVLWSRRPDEDGFLTLRLGLGTSPSRTTVKEPNRGSADPGMWDELQTALAGMTHVADVPVVADLADRGVLGIAGDPSVAEPVARALLAQVACLHSPAEVVITGVASRTSAPRWEWLAWLPHVDSPHSPLGAHLAASPSACTAVVTGVEELVARRRETNKGRGSDPLPRVVLVVEDDAPVERGRLVRLAEEGPDVGVVVLWCAPGLRRLPAACRAVVVADEYGVRTGDKKDGLWQEITAEELDEDTAMGLARHLAGVADAGAPTLDESDLPRSVGFLSVAGTEIADDAAAVVDKWRETGSILDRSGADPVRRSSDAPLRGVVGQGTAGEFVLDLRSQGPHALVGGTTGAGKSEFLQAWVLGMAAAHSPDRVTFLFVDYKGGAAFADCVTLPHCVGLVTDLSGHLVRRALTSLRAELRHREHLLAQAQAKDLLSLERTGDPRTPPALVIVVDEFAALVQEIPEFVDGVVDVAQRGRSLGLHLILATQRPAGVIKDNLRANTNLRIALRMADEHDSSDVLGSPMAAHFDPRIPGRGAVRTGPGRLEVFQSGYVGGRSDDAPAPAQIGIESLTFGPGEPWLIPPAPDTGHTAPADGPTDAARIVTTLRAAADQAAIPTARRPWLDEIPAVIALDTDSPHTDGDLPLGMVDVPADQAQILFRYRPDDDGSMVVYGTSGSGKSTALRTIVVSAATATGHVRIYALDFAGGALSMLEALPQVGSVVSGSDTERVVRLLGQTVAELDARAEAFAAARASTIAEYRALTGTDTPRLFLLIDGLASLRENLENDMRTNHAFAGLGRLLAEGRPLGIHVVMAAERPNAMTTAMAASVATRMVMRQSDENAYIQLGVEKDALGTDPLPGRAVLSGGVGDEIQIAVVDAQPDTAGQAAAIEAVADALAAADVPVAPVVRRLEALIRASTMPAQVGGSPVLGVADTTLSPIGFERSGTLLVAGMSGSGRTTTLLALAHALRRHRDDAPLYYIGPRRSPAAEAGPWHHTAHRPGDITELLAELQPLIDQPADDTSPLTLVVEAITDYAATEVEMPLAALIKAAKRNGHLVIAESDTTTWASISPPVSEIRNARRGLILQPGPDDGPTVLRVSFPRTRPGQLPPGRAIYTTGTTTTTIQIPLPDQTATGWQETTARRQLDVQRA